MGGSVTVRRRCGKLVEWTLPLLLLAIVMGAFPSHASAGSAPVTAQDVYKALKVDQVSGDYVVLVDTSASMKGAKYSAVKRALGRFLGVLSPSDHLSLLTFDVTPTLRYSGNVGSHGARIVNRLPAQPNGAYTDIGAAIQAGIAELSRPGASDVQTMALLTDGKHDPPAGSAYPTTSGSAWDKLRREAAKLPAQALQAYAIALGANTDAALLKEVFPQAIVVDLPTGQLPAYLDRIKESGRRMAAASIVHDDLKTQVAVEWPPSLKNLKLKDGRARTHVVLTSRTKYLPLVVSGLNVTATGGSFKVAGLPNQVGLGPGQSVAIPVTITWQTQKPFHIGKREVVESGVVSLSGDVTSPWNQVLTKVLGLKPGVRLVKNAGAVRASGEVGWGWGFIAVLLGLVAFAIGLTLYFWRNRNAILRGSLMAQAPGQPMAQATLNGMRVVKIGSGKDCRLRLSGRGRVTGRKIKSKRTRGRDLELTISYAADSKNSRVGRCKANGSTTIGETTFTYRV